MARTKMKRIDDELAALLEEARKEGVRMTVASRQLAEFAVDKGFRPVKKKKLPGRKRRSQ